MTVIILLTASLPVLAGAKIDIERGSYLDLGFRVHTLFVLDNNTSADPDWHIKQARFRMKGVINNYAMAFIQTDSADGGMEVIDGFVGLTIHPAFNIYAGRNNAPASRQNLTSSEAMLAMDRPAIANKTLTWGARAVPMFGTYDYKESNAGFNNKINNRDTGLTAHGYLEPYSGLHVKYYLGFYDGIQKEDKNSKRNENERFTGRIQANLFEAEDKYYNMSTYLGKKKTLGVGFSYDTQSEVARTEAGSWEDYSFLTADIFTEMPIGPGSVSFEAAFQKLNLGGAGQFIGPEKDIGTSATPVISSTDPTLNRGIGKQAEGWGYYAQTGYYINKIQPWVLYEDWTSNASGLGSFFAVRAGLTYYIKDQNANVKIGAEYFKAKESIDKSPVFSVAFGFFAQY